MSTLILILTRLIELFTSLGEIPIMLLLAETVLEAHQLASYFLRMVDEMTVYLLQRQLSRKALGQCLMSLRVNLHMIDWLSAQAAAAAMTPCHVFAISM